MSSQGFNRAKARAVVEPLEKRILYSADVAGLAADVLVGTVDDGESVHHQLMDAEAPVEERAASISDVGFHLVVIDATLADADTIARAAEHSGAQVLRFDPTSESSAEVLARVSSMVDESETRLESLSIVSHGSGGRFQLGNDWVDADLGAGELEAWSELGTRLVDGGNLYIYGCNLVDGSGEGQALLDSLAAATGADVFASTDLTGAYGDWDLEASSTGDEVELIAGLDGALDGGLLQAVTDTLADYNEVGFTGSGSYDDGAISFTVSVTGAGNIDWDYDGSTDTFSITGTSGTNSSSVISISDDNGGLVVGVLQINSDVGQLTIDTDIAEIRTATSIELGNATISGGTGTLGLLSVADSTSGDVTVTGRVDVINIGTGWSSTVHVTGDVGTVNITDDAANAARLEITGDVTTIEGGRRFKGTVDVGGDLGLFHVSVDIAGSAFIGVGGNVGTFDVGDDLAGTIAVAGSVTEILVAGTVTGDVTIQGDLDVFDATGTVSSTITAESVTGEISIQSSEVSYTNGFVTGTQVIYDGGPDTVTSSDPGLLAGLEGRWLMDEGGGQPVGDSSGNGNDATRGSAPGSDSSDPSWVYDNDVESNVLDFDGSNDFVDMGATFPAFSAMTVSAWVKLDSLDADQAIISAGLDGSESQWTLKTITDDGKISFHRYDSGYIGAQSTSSLEIGTWAHVTGTYNGAEWQIYINGVLEATFADAVGITQTSQSVYIGAISTNFGAINHLDGRIRDVRVYDRVLSDDEVNVLSGGEPGNTAPTADPLAIYVDEDTSVVISLSGTDIDAGDSVEKFRIDSLPSGSEGVLTLNGATVSIGDEITASQIAAGDLVFTPAGNYNGSSSFVFSVHDGDVWSPSSATVSITVDPVNDAPVALPTLSSASYGSPIAISLDASDPDLGDSVERYRIDTAPPAGSFYLAGEPVGVGAEITAAQIAAGDLVFVPSFNALGAQQFEVSAFDGDSWSLTSATATIEVIGGPVLPPDPEDEDTGVDDPAEPEEPGDTTEDSSDDESNSENQADTEESVGFSIHQGDFVSPILKDDARNLVSHIRDVDAIDASESVALESLHGLSHEEGSRSADGPDQREETVTARTPGMAVQELELLVQAQGEVAASLSHKVAAEVEEDESTVQPVEAAVVAASTALLAVLSRSTSLVAMAVASMPGWRYFDPLAIVSVPYAAQRVRHAVLAEAKAEDDESGGRLRDVLGG